MLKQYNMTHEQTVEDDPYPKDDPARIGSTATQGAVLLDVTPTVAVYRGSGEVESHSFERGFATFEHHMNMVFPETRSLDAILEGQIDRARKRNDDVVVLDLGGGVGNFTREPLADEAILKRSRKRLGGQSVGTQVRFYSVTDAPTVEDHLRVTPFPEADKPGNEQLGAWEINYSITSSQTLKKLLESLGEQSADVIVASSFMQYLHPRVFEGLLEDVIDTLKPGGRFMAFGYATLPERVLSIDDHHVEESRPVVFKDPASPEESGITGDALREWGRSLLADVQVTDGQIIGAIDRLRGILFGCEYYGQAALGDFRGDIKRALQGQLRSGVAPRDLFNTLLQNILPQVEDSERIQEMKRVKDSIIDNLALKNMTVASVEHRRIPNQEQGLDAIVIKKRLAGNQKRK